MNWRIRQHRPVVRLMRREQRLPNILTYLDIASTAGRMQLEFRAGAHWFAMGYNYNGKLKSAELLLQEDGSVKMIRRAETPKDYFATFDFCDILKNVKE